MNAFETKYFPKFTKTASYVRCQYSMDEEALKAAQTPAARPDVASFYRSQNVCDPKNTHLFNTRMQTDEQGSQAMADRLSKDGAAEASSAFEMVPSFPAFPTEESVSVNIDPNGAWSASITGYRESER
jgi:hypothetical protein